MPQSLSQKKITKEFDQRLRYIIKGHWVGFEPPHGVWDQIQSRLKDNQSEKSMPLVHAFPSVAVVRVLPNEDPGDPTILPATTVN
jgi:hypothetical protein